MHAIGASGVGDVSDVEPSGGGSSFVSRALLTPLSRWLAVAVLAATTVLPPDGVGVLVCWFKAAHGLPCPGCGLTRSLTSITHLRFAEAMEYHPFGFVAWLLMAALVGAQLAGAARREAIARWLEAHRLVASRVYMAFVVAFLGFGVARMVWVLANPGALGGV